MKSDRLEAQGWITCTMEIQYDRPNRKVYRITPMGEAELPAGFKALVVSPTVTEPTHSKAAPLSTSPQPCLWMPDRVLFAPLLWIKLGASRS